MKKFRTVLVLILSFMFFLTACGTNESNNANKEENTKSNTEENQDSLAKIKDDGKFLIGTEGTYPPFTFHDDKGDLTGFDVEIAREIAKRLGVEPEFKETQWDSLFAGLDAKRYDMIINQVGIRDDRKEKYDFSDPYITSAAVLVTRSDNEAVKSFEEIEGLKSAQSLTSNYADIAKSYGAEIVGVEGFNQAIELLMSNRVDVTINDKMSFLDFKKNKPDAQVKMVDTSEDTVQSGMLFRKGNETLIEEVNKALQEMIDDGTYLKISEKWFGEDVLN